MRRYLIVTTLFIITSLAWSATWQPLCLLNSEAIRVAIGTEDDDWILLGETPLSNYYHNNEVIIAKLYLREIASKLIYRVEYQGRFYATRWDKELKSLLVTINENTYKCDVPTESEVEDDEKNESAKFVGKWGFSSIEEWFVEITYKNGEYSFFLNPYYPYLDGEVVEKYVTATEFIYTKKSETDYRPQMRSKGWSYMFDDCDKNADIGYPKTGQYKYDKDVMYSTISISLTGNVPTYGVKKFHTYYYYQGTLTYADTDIMHDVTQLVRK